jgi:hypothetical protein
MDSGMKSLNCRGLYEISYEKDPGDAKILQKDTRLDSPNTRLQNVVGFVAIMDGRWSERRIVVGFPAIIDERWA